MTFQLLDEAIECETINHEMYTIPFNIIQRISSYSSDIYSSDEQRLEIETTDYETYTFSEREDCWYDLLAWIKEWANLPDDWATSADAEAFSNEITVLWQSIEE